MPLRFQWRFFLYQPLQTTTVKSAEGINIPGDSKRVENSLNALSEE